jgi:hypothetical protein
LSTSGHFETVFEQRKTGGVSTRPRQAIDEAAADRVDDRREHDRHGTGYLLQRRHGLAAIGQDDVGRERDQFGRVCAHAVDIAHAPAGDDPHVATVGPAQFLQPLRERSHPGHRFRIVRGQVDEYADDRQLRRLLRARRVRP